MTNKIARNYKRILICIAVIALCAICLCVFTACGDKKPTQDDNGNGGGTSSNTDTPVEPDPSTKVCKHTKLVEKIVYPTCVEDGYNMLVCEECGAVYDSEIVDALGHDMQTVEAKKPTCTEPGWEEYEYCTRCNYSNRVTIQPTGHRMAYLKAKNATCTEDGYAAHSECIICHYSEKAYTVYPATGHTLVHVEKQDSTCTSIGWEDYDRCTTCTYSTYKEIPKHHYGDDGCCNDCGQSSWAEYLKLELNFYGTAYKVVGYKGDLPANVVIPDYNEFLPVSEIVSNAFAYCSGLKHLYIGANVTEIGQNIFEGANNLETIDVSVNNGQFYGDGNCIIDYTNGTLVAGCNKSVIPTDGRVKNIGANAFAYCLDLVDVTIPDSVRKIGVNAFWGSGIKQITIPVSVTQIGEGAFGKCSNLASVQWLASDCMTAGSSKSPIFNNCTKLTELFIGDDVTGIPAYAFMNCKSISAVKIPEGVTTIGNSAFNSCTALTTVNWDAIDCALAKDSNYYIFENCEKLAVATFGDSVRTIPNYIFANCTSLKNVTIPNGVKSIGDAAFIQCESIKNITIPSSVETIGEDVFSRCSSLENISIPFVGAKAGMTSSDKYQYPLGYLFGMSSYNNCIAIRQTYYASSTSSTTSNYFYFPSSLKNVIVTGGNILCGAFSNCSNLTNITLGDKVTSIGVSAFENCTCISSIAIPLSVTSIGTSAFANCSGLTSLSIPASVTSIGNSISPKCSNLKNVSVEIGNSKYHSAGNCIIETASKTLISGCDASVIPDDGTVEEIGDNAFVDCKGLKNVEIPSTVTKIGQTVFCNCTALESITIPFVGAQAGATSSDKYQYPLGYLFGTKGSGVATQQIYYGTSLMQKTSTVYYIPSSLKVVTVTGGDILYGAFYNCKGLTNVILGDDVRKIEEYAFYCCELENITIGSGVESIGEHAFVGCSYLNSVTIPASVTNIYERAFCQSNVKNVTIGDNAQDEANTNIGTYAFSDCSKLESVVIGNGVKSIDTYAFSNCSALESVIIKNGVESIVDSAFSGCGKLQSITFPDSVESISAYAFNNCSSLANITFDGDIENIGSYAFNNCRKLASVTFGGGVKNIGSYAFYNCEKLTAVNISDIYNWMNVLFVNNYSNPLYYAHNLYLDGELVTEIIIPKEMTTVKNYIFEGCSSLTSLTIPDGIIGIGEGAFSYCDNLVNIILPDSIETIGGSAFRNCDGIKNITIPDGVKSIGSYAFMECNGIQSIVIPDSVETLYDYTFYRCDSLRNVTIGDGVKNIGAYAFAYNSNLFHVTVGASVTNIANYAFTQCVRLFELYNKSSLTMTAGTSINGNIAYYAKKIYTTEEESRITIDQNGFVLYEDTMLVGYVGNAPDITIPECVRNIDKNAFSGNNFIKSVIIHSDVESIGERAFSECRNLKTVTIMNGVESIGSKAFYNCIGLTTVAIPASVTSIDGNIFNGCYNLVSISVGNENSKYHSVDNCIIETESKTLIAGCKTSVIPDDGSVTSIGEYAFEGCRGLFNILIPSSIKSIGDFAFLNCNTLIEVCNKSTLTITAGSSANGYVGNYAKQIYKATNGSKLVTDKNGFVIYDGTMLVGYVGDATEIDIPASVTSIGDYAFYRRSDLVSITIPVSVTSIGSYVFYECSSLTTMTIPAGVTSIGTYVFYGCSGLENIIFKDTITWYRTNNKSYWEDKFNGSLISVESSSENVNLFVSINYGNYWYKKKL